MAKEICRYKNYDDFYKNRTKIWSDIRRYVDDIHTTDVASFEKVVFQGKSIIRMSYDNHVEDSAELKKARAQISALEKEKKRTYRFVQAQNELESDIESKQKELRLIESKVSHDGGDPKKDKNFLDTAKELKKLLKAKPIIAKKTKEYETATEAYNKADSGYDVLKKKIEQTIPMSIQFDGTNLLLCINKKPEASVKLKATIAEQKKKK